MFITVLTAIKFLKLEEFIMKGEYNLKIQKIDLFVKYINKINSIFKTVYNSKHKYENIWSFKNNKFVMYEKDQFPSYVEILLDYDSLPKTKKGAYSKKALEIIEFLNEIKNYSFSINSISLFELFKNKKDIIEIVIEDKDYIEFICNNNISIKYNYNLNKEIVLNEEMIMDRSSVEPEIVQKILDFENNPFNYIINFVDDKTITTINEKLSDSYLEVKINKKFIPFLKNTDYSLETEIYMGPYENIYDLAFCTQYKEIKCKSLIRVLNI